MALVVEIENNLKGKYDEMERKLQEKEKELENKIISPIVKSSKQTIVQAMSQVRLKDLQFEKPKQDPREYVIAKGAIKENQGSQISGLGGQVSGDANKE